MIPPAESLLKYDNAVLVSTNTDRKLPKPLQVANLTSEIYFKDGDSCDLQIGCARLDYCHYYHPFLYMALSNRSAKGRPLRVSPQQPATSAPVPPPPKIKPTFTDTSKQENEDILNTILPPREWVEGNQLWVQHVSSAASTRADVIHLEEQLDTKLQQRQARETGICPVRRELHSQCFDELIRQVTINCAERGLLLLRVRDEIQMTIAAYQTLYESSVAFGVRKALQAEQGKADMEKRVSDLENEIQDLKKQVNEQIAKCEAIQKRENEKRQVEEKKHTEEIEFLRRTNQQLKAQLEGIITPKKDQRQTRAE